MQKSDSKNIDNIMREYIHTNMYFRKLNQKDIEEMENLHKEWFPLNYPDSFYQNVFKKNNTIALGCFLQNPYFTPDKPASTRLPREEEEQKESKIQRKNSKAEEGKEVSHEESKKDDFKDKQGKEEIMLGTIICRIKTENDDVMNIWEHYSDMVY